MTQKLTDTAADAPDDSDAARAILLLSSTIASAHRNIKILGAVMLVGFAIIGLGVAINGGNAVRAGAAASTAKKAIPKARREAAHAARKEAVRVAKQTRVVIRRQTRRQTRLIVRRELGRRGLRGLQGLRGRSPTPAEVDAAVNRIYGTGVPTASQVVDALMACLAAGGCGAVRGPAGENGSDAPPITTEMIDAAVARHCEQNGCGTPGPKGDLGSPGAMGLPGPPPAPAMIRFIDPITGVEYTCLIDFTIGPDTVQPCTSVLPPPVPSVAP